MRRLPFAVAPIALAALVLAACGGEGGSSGPPKVAQVEILALTVQLEVGATTQLAITLRDGKGNVLPGRPVSWTSTPASVATVDATGIVAAVAPGSVTVTATADGVSGTQAMTVVAVPVAIVAISPREPRVREGATIQVSAETQDGIGRMLPGRAITWSSANTTIATVSSSGLVSGLTSGTTYLHAASEGKRDSVVLRVQSLIAPIVSATSPATWTPGTQATITGTNFSPDLIGNEVFVLGVRTQVDHATPTSLTITIPTATSLPCTPTGPVPVIVSVNGDSALATANLTMATPRHLAVGASLVLTSAAEVACNEFAVTGGTYLVTAFNTAPQLTAPRVSFRLVGATRSASPSAVASLAAVPTAPSPVPQFGPLAQQATTAGDRHVVAHLASVEASRQLLLTKGNPVRALRARQDRKKLDAARAGVSLAVSASQPPQVGDMMWKRMMRTFNTYSNYDSILTRVVYSGSKLVIVEDTANPLARQMDAEFARIGAEFDGTMYKFLEHFGDPLVLDPLTDNNGRIIAIFSKRVNDYSAGVGTLLGYVTSCDFFPQVSSGTGTFCAPSNEGEYFYAFVPNPGATGAGAWSLDRWRRIIRSTLVHEVKHIAGFAERIARDAPSPEDVWLEEATAQQAAELWARDMYGRFGRGADIDWAGGPRCDYAQVSAACPDPFEGIMHHFGFLYRHYSSNETRSILTDRSISPDPVIYGSSWSFVRWATDVLASDEKAFTRSLVQQSLDRGVSNITARTGRPWSELMGYWSLASLADNYPGGTVNDPRLQLPSWNTRDIFAQMAARIVTIDVNGNQTPLYPRSWPLNVRTPSFGNFPEFTNTVTSLPPGGFAAWEISGTQVDPQVLGLRALGTSSAPPANVGLAIVRVR